MHGKHMSGLQFSVCRYRQVDIALWRNGLPSEEETTSIVKQIGKNRQEEVELKGIEKGSSKARGLRCPRILKESISTMGLQITKDSVKFCSNNCLVLYIKHNIESK